MGLFAFVRAALIPGELADTKSTELRAYTDGSLWVRLAAAVAAPAPASALHDGTTFTVPTGTATAISSSTAWTYGVWVQADPANTDTVYVRASAGATTAGRALAPGDAWDLGLQDLSKLLAVSASSGQKLRMGGLS